MARAAVQAVSGCAYLALLLALDHFASYPEQLGLGVLTCAVFVVCLAHVPFERRVQALGVVAAAVKLGVVVTPELDEDETEDLVALAAQGVIDEPASRLGRYLVRNWERVSLVDGESLVYWLRKLIFRGAWLDHQVKRSALEVVWDDREAEFAYQHPGGGRPLLELAPVPSWHELKYRP